MRAHPNVRIDASLLSKSITRSDDKEDFMKAFAIVLAMLAGASPAFAEHDYSAAREVTVGYSDLDLTTPQGRETFGERVTHAINTVCDSASAPPSDEMQCRRETRIDVLTKSRGEVRAALISSGAMRPADVIRAERRAEAMSAGNSQMHADAQTDASVN
jgi:UrcA family protein